MPSIEETNFSPADLPLDLQSVQQLTLEADDQRDKISDEFDGSKASKSKRESNSQHNLAKDPVFISLAKMDYDMRHRFRGIAIIFNHKRFNPVLKCEPREGTDDDCTAMSGALKALGFKIICYEDYSFKEIKTVLKKLSKEDHSERDTIVITVLTYGEAGGVLFAKDKRYNAEDLWSDFTGDKCSTLCGKPKIFFIQACQSDGIDYQSDGIASSTPLTETDSDSCSYRIPNHADILVCYSTIPGFYSWRNSSKLSWFVEALCSVLGERYRDNHILDILTIVFQKVAVKYPADVTMHQKRQFLSIFSSLTRQVFFKTK